jgi:hypothetical protein
MPFDAGFGRKAASEGNLREEINYYLFFKLAKCLVD